MADGRRAVITGAASGIGRCFATTLAAGGYELLLVDVDAAGLAATQAALPAAPARIATAVADVADRAATEAAFGRHLATCEHLDLLVHCAAILGAGTWAAQPADEFERVVRIDLLGTATVIRTALPHLRAARGQAVVLASTAAVHGWPGLAAYSAAKFGVAGLCDAIRPELARDGVNVITVFPLLIDTPLLQRTALPPILRRGRRIPPQAVVDAALRAAARRRPRVWVPASVRLIALLHGLAPGLLDWWGARAGLEPAAPS